MYTDVTTTLLYSQDLDVIYNRAGCGFYVYTGLNKYSAAILPMRMLGGQYHARYGWTYIIAPSMRLLQTEYIALEIATHLG